MAWQGEAIATQEQGQGVEVPDLRQEALELLLQIPRGKVTTYRALAAALGDEVAARAIGQIMAQNDQPERYPCYKVVHSDGAIGEYSAPGGKGEKVRRLQAEGVPVRDGRVVNLQRYLFTGFRSTRPLERLRRLQEELSRRIVLEPDRKGYRTAAGVDVSYIRAAQGEEAVAGYVMLELDGPRLRKLRERTLTQRVSFPYIPTYLAFRELPLLQRLLQEVQAAGELADVVFVDGNGILHPRHAGIASHLGVLLDIPTIGITKSLLCGEVDLRGLEPGEVRYVVLRGTRVGAAIKLSPRGAPIYVSPGHRIDLETAVELTLRASSGHRLPEPIRAAHSLSRAAVSERSAQGREGRGQDKEEGQLAFGF